MLRRDDLRTRLGYVQQDAPALAGTLRDNLLLAAPDADDTGMLAMFVSLGLAAVAQRDPTGRDAQIGEDGCCCPEASGNDWLSPGSCWRHPRSLAG